MPIPSEETIWANLTGLQSQLEPIVERYLSEAKTGNVTEFKGEKKYLSDDIDESPHDFEAAELLNAVYAVQKAHRAGDHAQTLALAMLVRELDVIWQLRKSFGIDPIFAAVEKKFLRPMNCAKGGENSGIFKSDEAKQALAFAFAKNKHRDDRLEATRRTLENYKLKDGRTITATTRTISTALKRMGLLPAPVKKRSRGKQ